MNIYCNTNSFVHRINPAIKFILFIFIVVILFLPIGFIFQIIISIFVFLIFFISKIYKQKLYSIFKSIVFMFLFLFLINWFTFRNPGYFLCDNETNTILGNFYELSFFEKIFSKENFLNNDSFINNYENYLVINGNIKNLNEFPEYTDRIRDFWNQKGDFHLFVGRIWGTGDNWNLLANNWIKGFRYTVDENGNVLNFIPICHTTSYAISWRSILMTLYVSHKIFTLIILSTILTSTTSSVELTCALEDIFYPLKIFRFPVNEFAMIIAITIRYIPSLLSEAQRILNAQASRGVDFKNGRIKDKVISLTSLVIPMFLIAFRKAEDLSSAMDSRSYNPRYARTRYRTYGLKFSDLLVLLFWMIIFGFLLILCLKKFFIPLIGSFDWLVNYALNTY